jgi:hypothetical protein
MKSRKMGKNFQERAVDQGKRRGNVRKEFLGIAPIGTKRRELLASHEI